ncbi:hypothetical protein CM15mP35_04510 [bacterium]|nr:MAG: hypothetical protein CM15mV39_0840 [uncultured marine virus]GIR20190.1 MAG: hypothetical protein CM15mP35_04510 [bacterium]
MGLLLGVEMIVKAKINKRPIEKYTIWVDRAHGESKKSYKIFTKLLLLGFKISIS